MTPETETILKHNLNDIENDICHLAHKKLMQPENEYKIDKEIFLLKKIKRSIEFELNETVKIQLEIVKIQQNKALQINDNELIL